MTGINDRKIDILLVDDHKVVLMGLAALLEAEADMRVVGKCGDGATAVKMAGELLPDVVVLDLMMPVMNGIEAAKQIKSRYPKIRIVMLTMYSNEGYVLKALESGVDAYVEKITDSENLVESIKRVAAHSDTGKVLTQGPNLKLLSPDDIEALRIRVQHPLTTRETEILERIANGFTNKEIASNLNVDLQTVKNHVGSILKKLSVTSRENAAALYFPPKSAGYSPGGIDQHPK